MTDSWTQLKTAVTCDACGARWIPRVRIKRTATGGEAWHFRCPHCSKRYDMVTISRRGVAIRAEIAQVRADVEMPAEQREAELARLTEELEHETVREDAAQVDEEGDHERTDD